MSVLQPRDAAIERVEDASQRSPLRAALLTRSLRPASRIDRGLSLRWDQLRNRQQPRGADQFDPAIRLLRRRALDYGFLGMTQVDAAGNINVSRFGFQLPGYDGFINITQNANQIVFWGTLMMGGLEISAGDVELSIEREGDQPKFLDAVGRSHSGGSTRARSTSRSSTSPNALSSNSARTDSPSSKSSQK